MVRKQCPFCKVRLVPLDDGEAGGEPAVLRCLLCGYTLAECPAERLSGYEDLHRRRLAMSGEVEKDGGD